ncbi:phage holin family protein [Enterobacter hormaechei subsp. steigerwaltii]|nr:phage holin family protein [Enterobacter hormaechei subsp. steigerwaltii]
MALYFVPDIHPLALLGFGSVLGIAGQHVVEAWLRKMGFTGIFGKGDTK